MNDARYKWLLYVILIVILSTISIQVYWNYKNYQINKKIMNHEMKKNDEFYKNCTEYFEFLRKNSTVDFEFEDEYYFTMPAISSHQ